MIFTLNNKLRIAHVSYPNAEMPKLKCFVIAIESAPGKWERINERLMRKYLDQGRAEFTRGTVPLKSRPTEFRPGAFV
jgi:hypothetical protein